MSIFNSLENFLITKELLNDITEVYQIIGKNEYIINELGSDYCKYLENSTIENASFALAEFLNLNVSTDRKRLLITKDAKPKNNEEKHVVGIKAALKKLYADATCNIHLNSIDILDLLKMMLGKQVSLSFDDFKIGNDEKKSKRYMLNNLFDEYDKCIAINYYEPIILSCICLMSIYNINPYSENNDLALIITMEYLLIKCRLTTIKYVDFIPLIINNLSTIKSIIAKGSVNYEKGTIFYADFVSEVFTMIKISNKELMKIVKNKGTDNRNKADAIEIAIMESLPSIFSKNDIMNLFPNTSVSTIVRVLNKLRDKKYIIPLGTGRTAKWKRIIEKEDVKYIFKNEEGEKNAQD